MVGAETSYMTSGNFFDMEKGTSGQNHLEAWLFRAGRLLVKVGKTWPIEGLQVIGRGVKLLAEVCLCAHMKSFSWVNRRLYVVMGSLQELRCSRITRSAGRPRLSKAIFAWRSVGKVLFSKGFFPKVDSPFSPA